MAIDPASSLLGYADYAAIADGKRYQVIDGVLVLTPSPTPRHQRVVLRLGRYLDSYAEASGMGQAFLAPLDVVLRAERPAIVVQPDVFFVDRDHLAIIGETHIAGAPTLVVEVLSPSTARLDTVYKHDLYARHGVAEYWIVPSEFDRVEVLRLGPEGRYGRPELYLLGDRLTSPLLPGFALDVASLFEDGTPPRFTAS